MKRDYEINTLAMLSKTIWEVCYELRDHNKQEARQLVDDICAVAKNIPNWTPEKKGKRK